MRNIGIAIGAVLAVMVVLLLVGRVGMMSVGGFAGMRPGMMRGYGGYGMMGGNAGDGTMGRAGISGGFGYNPLGGLVSVELGALVLAELVLLVLRLVRGSAGFVVAGESMLDILKARYAKGEITKEQLETTRRDVQ